MLLKSLNKSILLVFLLFFSFSTIGQERFNVRHEIGMNACLFSGVVEIEGGYGIVGNGVYASDNETEYPLFFTRFNHQGEFIDRKMYSPESGIYLITYESGLTYLNDLNQYSCIGYKDDPANPNEGFLASFNQEGDTIQIKYFTSPYLPDEGPSAIAPVGICQSTNEDNSIFISSNILNLESGTGGDFYIQRMTPDGEVLWEYIYATEAQPEYSNALLPTYDGGVIGLVNIFSNPMGLIRLDTDGNELLNINTNYFGRVNDMVWSEDNDIVAAGIGSGNDGFITGRIFKIDTLGNMIWDTILGDGYALSFQNQFHKVACTLNGSEYVAGGTKKEFLPEEEQSDSTGTAITQGWLVKVNEDGDVLWDRTYHYMNTPNDEHTFNDLKATSDGGYIFCGESRDDDWQNDYAYSEGNRQQGWLVKVDEYGCLVEGCQLSDNISEQETVEEKYFKAGPIPAGDFLNIYQSVTAHFSTYQLINSHGQVIEEFPSMSKGTTMMVDVSSLPAAAGYQLVLIDGERVLQRQKIIIK